jgi:hypothetical protein
MDNILTFKKCSTDGDRHLEHIICPIPSWFATHLQVWHWEGVAVTVTCLAHTSMNSFILSLCAPLSLCKRWSMLKSVPFVSNARGTHKSFGSAICKEK